MSRKNQVNGLIHGDLRVIELMTGKSYEVIKSVAHGRKDSPLIEEAIGSLLESRRDLINNFRQKYKTISDEYL